jgi:phenylpyruvate tautomerase PptA (4-oxalocrotonate tautomerase family)
MPTIFLNIPQGSFPGKARADLVARIHEAAARAEQIPANPHNRAICWVSLQEGDQSQWTCGGLDVSAQVLPCVVQIYLPEGVLDDDGRGLYVKLIDDAFRAALPSDDDRQVMTSVLLHEVPNGRWGGNGKIWRLSDIAKAAGFEHLQHLVVTKGKP